MWRNVVLSAAVATMALAFFASTASAQGFAVYEHDACAMGMRAGTGVAGPCNVATAAMFKVGAQLVTPQTEKSLGEVLLLSLADWFRIFIGLVLPLLALAALIEVYVTPQMIKLAFPYL